METIRASAAAGILACLWKNTPVPHAVESNPSTSCLCLCSFGRPGHENVWEPPRFHMCGYLFETFPPVLASCSTFYLLVCSRVSRGRRGSEALSHAVRLKSTPLLSFTPPPQPPFLTLGKLWTEVRLPPDAAASKRKNKMFKQRRLESSPGYFYVTRPSSVLAVAFASQQSSGRNFPDAGCVSLVVIWKRKTSLMWTDTQYRAHFIQNGKRSVFTK